MNQGRAFTHGVALANYPLPDITGTAVGTFKVRLTSSLVGLTTPTANTILELGEWEESADIKIGVSQIGTLRLRIRDDTSTYTEGFWYKVFGSTSELRFYLTENGVDTFYFYGLPQEETVEWEEYFIGSTYVREVTLSLLSVAYTILDTTTATWMTHVVDNSVDTGAVLLNDPSWKISVKGLFSAMLSASGLNSTYSESDTTFVYNTVDFRYTQGGNNYTLDDVWIAVKIFAGGGSHSATEYFLASSGNRLSAKFATLRDLLKHLLANFGVIMVMDYNTTTQRHLIKLVQRGRAYSTALTFGSREIKGNISKSYDLLGDATQATFILDSTSFVWFSKKYLDGKSTSTVPNYVKFDIDYQTIFLLNVLVPQSGISHSRQLYLVSGSTWTIITGIDYFNYTTGLYVTAVSPHMQEATAGYVYYRFTNKFSLIRRTYGTFKGDDASTNSHTNLRILRRTSINDGTGAANYYANKVIKRPESNEVEIDWIKETA